YHLRWPKKNSTHCPGWVDRYRIKLPIMHENVNPLTRVTEISQQKEIFTGISINSKIKLIQTIHTQFKLTANTNHFIQGPTYDGNRRTISPSPAAQTNSPRQHNPPYKLAPLINDHLNNRTTFSS
ncbi:hypothetical protein, partial [Pseudomonas aeruginosa]|uniref:hypothetical protein n=1 Tax=Pseudomonas aeruginosa TaxID=287 RepID=UPI001C0BEC43